MLCKLDRAHADGASRSLHQHRAPLDVAPEMDVAMGCDAGYPQARALVRRHVLKKRSDVIQRDHEWAIGLCAVAPYCRPDPVGRHAFADLVHAPCAVAMRNDPRIRDAS
jgi:hypothetical protein